MIKKLSDNYLNKYYLFFIGLSLLVLIVVATSFYVVGSPSTQRAIRQDNVIQERMYDLASRIDGFYQTDNALPKSIDVFFALQDESDLKILSEIKKYGIEYQIIDSQNYKLCANFEISNYPKCFDGMTKKDCEITKQYDDRYSSRFLHPAGYYCRSYSVKGLIGEGDKNLDASPIKIDPIVDNDSLPSTISRCGLESCNGLDLTCGPNIPEMCPAVIGVADRCRDFAKCTQDVNGCSLVYEPGFKVCESCVDTCSKRSESVNLDFDAFACVQNCLQQNPLTTTLPSQE